MESTILPSGLVMWLNQQNWLVLSAHEITGGFAATIYHLHLRANDQNIDVIYKQLAKDRTGELSLIPNVMDQLSGLAPRVYGVIAERDETGILFEYLGDTLKSTMQHLSQRERTEAVRQATIFLASLHKDQEHNTDHLIKSGITPYYPISSAVAWAHTAIKELSWVAQNGFSTEVSEKTVTKSKAMLNAFYPHYHNFLQPRVTLTHGDPHFENIIVTKQGFHLIDWEGACITSPQRDLAIFLQDVLDEHLFHTVWATYRQSMALGGWDVENKAFITTFHAFLFDNTLMMLGFEIQKFRKHYLAETEIRTILRTKLSWLHDSFTQVFASSS